MAWPTIGFELTNNGRVTQNLPPCDTLLERIGKFYGPELASALLHVHREERGVRIEAYAAPPAQSRATAQWQYAYVNGRYVRDKFIQHAIKASYRGLMEPNRHGVVFLFLTVDPGDVDVNVHPTKIEVRWADSNLIHSQVLSALRETFQRADLTPALTPRSTSERSGEERAAIDPKEQERMRMELASVLKSASPIQPDASGGGSSPHAPLSGGADRAFGGGAPAAPIDGAQAWRSLYGDAPRDHATNPSNHHTPESTVEGAIPAGRTRVVQMHNLYLVAETEDGIVIIDQHALHERVMYEQLRERITSGSLESQRLLLPETLRATPGQLGALSDHAELIDRLGIEATPFGSDSVAVHAFPTILKDTDVEAFMRDLLDRLAQRPTGGTTEEMIHEVLDMMACKAAVKAGDSLTQPEIDALMEKRHLVDRSSSCPHGRPTMLRLSRSELDRQFKRT